MPPYIQPKDIICSKTNWEPHGQCECSGPNEGNAAGPRVCENFFWLPRAVQYVFGEHQGITKAKWKIWLWKTLPSQRIASKHCSRCSPYPYNQPAKPVKYLEAVGQKHEHLESWQNTHLENYQQSTQRISNSLSQRPLSVAGQSAACLAATHWSSGQTERSLILDWLSVVKAFHGGFNPCVFLFIVFAGGKYAMLQIDPTQRICCNLFSWKDGPKPFGGCRKTMKSCWDIGEQV